MELSEIGYCIYIQSSTIELLVKECRLSVPAAHSALRNEIQEGRRQNGLFLLPRGSIHNTVRGLFPQSAVE